jgi:hypothetical protein
MDMGWWELIHQIPWGIWIAPMALWGIFILLVYMAMVGMAGIFSHQWIENEKMNFPLLRVPEILSQEGVDNGLWKYFKHKYFLLGFCIPLFLHMFNGLHTYFPQVPEIPTLVLIQPYIPKEGLLSGFLKLKIYIYPAFIGFAFLASKQVSFSLWFFFILGGLLPGILQSLGWRFPAAALGTTFGPVLSRVEEMQMIGAFAVFFFFILWLSRGHLTALFLSILDKKKTILDYHGFLAPKTALYLFMAGFAGVTCWLSFFGMGLFATIIFLCTCFMLQLVSAKLICQGGLPFFTLTLAPSDGFLAAINTRLIDPSTLAMGLAVQKTVFLDLREALLPSLFHSSKLSDGSSPRNRFLWGLIWAILVGLVVSFVSMLAIYYKFGIDSLPDSWAVETTRRVHENMAHLLTHPEESKTWSIIFTAVGAIGMLLLVMGYHLFIWWPLHPIGFLTTYSSAMHTAWFCFFLGWLCNSLSLRYGGANFFGEVRRTFIGLVVGDLTMAVVWLIVGMFAPVSYHVLPL